jgi:hypothetical protein
MIQLIIGLLFIFVFLIVIQIYCIFDLKKIEKSDPKFRQYLRDKYKF